MRKILRRTILKSGAVTRAQANNAMCYAQFLKAGTKMEIQISAIQHTEKKYFISCDKATFISITPIIVGKHNDHYRKMLVLTKCVYLVLYAFNI